MRGRVRAIKADAAAVETEFGEYTVVRMLGGRLSVGDEVEGELAETGETTLRVVSGGELDVHVEEAGCSKPVASDHLRRLSR
jgi:hypothetical protein